MLLLLIFLVVSSTLFLFKLGYSNLYLPWRIQSHFLRQGVTGPRYRPVVGNIPQIQVIREAATAKPLLSLNNHIVHRVLPFFAQWSEQYGQTFLYWFGSTPRLVTSDPDMIKDVLMNPSGAFRKIRLNPQAGQLFGNGLASLSGDKWAMHRGIATQAFVLDRVKEWIPEIIGSTTKMLEKWEQMRVESGKEDFDIDILQHLHELAADTIAKIAFGSCYEEGKRIFALQEEQHYLFTRAIRNIYIPGFRYLPTKKNRERKRIDTEIRESIRRLNRKNTRLDQDSKNLLTLLSVSHKNPQGVDERMVEEDIIEECKTFYFAGKETTATLLTWALLLLAKHPEWQSRAREEVLRVFGEKQSLDAESLTSLKLITMIINETLRLYPPVGMIIREATKSVKLGKLDIPVGTQVVMPLVMAHHDVELWGEDAAEFNPLRFEEPRKHLASLIPFGLGQRMCVGPNLTLTEAKISLSMVLRDYILEVSPTYVHAPILVVVMQPQYGVQLILKRRNNN